MTTTAASKPKLDHTSLIFEIEGQQANRPAEAVSCEEIGRHLTAGRLTEWDTIAAPGPYGRRRLTVGALITIAKSGRIHDEFSPPPEPPPTPERPIPSLEDLKSGVAAVEMLERSLKEHFGALERAEGDLGTLRGNTSAWSSEHALRISGLRALISEAPGRQAAIQGQLGQAKSELLQKCSDFSSKVLTRRLAGIRAKIESKVSKSLRPYFAAEDLGPAVGLSAEVIAFSRLEGAAEVELSDPATAVKSAQQLTEVCALLDTFESKH